MKLAHLKIPDKYKDDVERIGKVFISYGILIPKPDILVAWGMYSETKGVEWEKLLEKDDDIYLAIIDYIGVEEW